MIPVDKVVCVRRHARNDERYNYRLKLTNAVHTLRYFLELLTKKSQFKENEKLHNNGD